MKQKSILFDTITNQPISDILPDLYSILYPKGLLKEHEVNLIVVDTPAPDFNHLTHRLINDGYTRVGNNWVRQWRVEPLTEKELTRNEWGQHDPKWKKRLRVVADKGLKMKMANVLTYWDDEGMPRDEKDGFVRLWCRELLGVHDEFIAAANIELAPYGMSVIVEDIPAILIPPEDETPI